MELYDLCMRITKHEPTQLSEDHAVAHRIMHPEYSINSEEVKTFPLSKNDPIFILCWNIQAEQRLYATIKPSETPFSYCSSFLSGDKTQLHTHDYIELAYVVKGEFKQTILGKDILFKQGELCLIDKNCLHQDYLFSQPAVIIFIGLANDIFNEIVDRKITKENITNFLQSALMKQKNLQQYLHFKPLNKINRHLEENLTHLVQELSSYDEASNYICKGLLMRIFKIISTEYEFSLSKTLRREMNWIIFGEITKYIQEHYNHITIKDLTNRFHFQEDYFNRLLKAKTGMKYSEYVQQIRLSEAEKLLVTTNLNIDDIMESIGYHNKGYFYKIFMEKNNMTPAVFRKNNR